MASVTVVMSGDDTRLIAANNRLFAAQEKALKKFDESVAKARQVKESNDNAANSIKGMAEQYVTLNAGASLLNKLAQEQNDLQTAALEKTKAVASAQSDAIKNLAGMSFLQQADLIGKAAEKIAKDTGFANRPAIIQALAAGVSAGGTVEEAKSAVAAAAAINKTTPEQIGSTASGAIDLARVSGIASAEKNISLLLNTGAVSRVESLDKLANSLAKTLGNVAATTPNVDKETATREAAAMFAVFNRASNDRMGDSTVTANNQFAAYLREFFTEGGGQKDVSDKIAKLEADKAITEKEAFNIKQAEAKLKAASGADKEKAQVALNDLKERATLTAIEEKKLAELKKQQSNLQNFKDPGSLSGRMEAIQSDAELRKAFLEKMPGEAAFKLPMEMLVTAGSDAFKEFKADFKTITYDEQVYSDLKKQMVSATPQLAIADIAATAESNIEQFNLDPQAAAIAEIKKIRTETLPRIRSYGIPGAVQSVVENTNEMTGLGNVFDGTVESAASHTRQTFRARRGMLERGGITEQESHIVALIDSQIKAIDAIVAKISSTKASEQMSEAAKQMQDAATRMGTPPSVAPAARAQAATAGGY